MDAYAQVLSLLDNHYPHIAAWERIVYSYRVVEYCKVAEIATPVDVLVLDEIMAFIDGWWMERIKAR